MAMESPAFANQSSSYTAEQTRRAVFAAFARTAANSPGIIIGGLLSTSDLQLSAPGSGLSVNVSTGECIIGGTEGGAQGGYYARATSQTNLTISTANPSNPRIDTVCATISDSAYTEPTGGSGNQVQLQVVTGTATAGATLSNLNGAASLPLSSLLLGYVLVPTSASNIITADIANVATVVQTGPQPQYGRGYEWSYTQITSPVTVSSSTESSGTTIISPAAFTPDGTPVLVEFFAPYIATPAAVGYSVYVDLFEGATEIGRFGYATTPNTSAAQSAPFIGRLRFTPTNASHTYTVTAWANNTGTLAVGAGAGGTGNYMPAFIRFTKV